ncbi:hypothetical protein V8B55DRAFT_1474771 [Mucor lusitanicus]|uniref:SAM domain-containing protein n=1 Tax=Mucor circinelloides f. lusitanicus TaxID=29924 RepID=A0A8H4BGI5_MUCCL|nr:hypothetical protein FB192DRAFT_1375086 [Mucor lusitanicus]
MEHVLMWDENKVAKWLSSIGYASFEKQFREQGITGDVLVNLDHESLRDLSILTVGQRMDLLKNIYQLKIHYRVPVNEWDYIPPSVLYETDWLGQNGMADYRKIEAAFQERDARIKRLTEDLQRVNHDMSILREEIGQIIKLKDKKALQNDSNSIKSATSTKVPYSHHTTANSKHVNSPTKINNSLDYHHNNMSTDDKLTPNVMINDGGAIKVYGDKISKIEHEPESSKNVRLLLDDPTSKVITSALKKYNVASDWQQYALWIQYGPHDNMQERALGYDERPLRISQKLKEAKQNPVFVLKHVKDNKPFIPPNYSHPRPAPPKPHDNSNNKSYTKANISPLHSNPNTSTSTTSTTANNSTATTPPITSGRVGFEVVIPVMSSSMSSPTTTTSTSSSKRTPPPPTQQPYNNELGLDNAIVNAIFSINNSNPQNP